MGNPYGRFEQGQHVVAIDSVDRGIDDVHGFASVSAGTSGRIVASWRCRAQVTKYQASRASCRLTVDLRDLQGEEIGMRRRWTSRKCRLEKPHWLD